MTQHQQQEAASVTPVVADASSTKLIEKPLNSGKIAQAFDPAAWLAAWSDHGGIAMLVGERLWLGRLSGVDRGALTALDTLRGHLHRPGAPDALAGLLRANAGGWR